MKATARELMEQGFARVDEEDPVSKAMGQIRRSGQDNVVLLRGKTYQGMLSKRSLMRTRVDFTKAKAKSFAKKVPVAEPTDGWERVAELMLAADSREIPVQERGTVVGVVPVKAVMGEIWKEPALKGKAAKDAAVWKPVTVSVEATVGQALSLMRKKNVRKLPALDKTGKVVGLLTFEALMEHQLMRALESNTVYRFAVQGHTPEKESDFSSPVKHMVSQSHRVVSENEALTKIAAAMAEGGVEAVIVKSKEKPAGIITYRNLLEAALAGGGKQRNLVVRGLPETETFGRMKALAALEECHDRLERRLGKGMALKAAWRVYHREGMRQEFEVALSVRTPNLFEEAVKKGWSKASVAQDAAKALERLIRKQR